MAFDETWPESHDGTFKDADQATRTWLASIPTTFEPAGGPPPPPEPWEFPTLVPQVLPALPVKREVPQMPPPPKRVGGRKPARQLPKPQQGGAA